MNGTNKDIDPASELRDEDEESSLPEVELESASPGTLAAGRAAILRFAKLAPSSAGVYRMIDARGDVLYVGKAKNIKKRVTAYARPTGHDSRIARMIAATLTLEFVTTKTETEALLLEANLIKRLRPRFNVLLRDDKSFPYILITSDHWAPQILKHRGARTRSGRYYGPFASAGAVNRTINALERAFLLRSCSDSYFEARTRPCLLYQIKRCSAPCTREIDFAGYTELVREANEFLSGRSQSVQTQLAGEMDKASAALDFERAAIYRDRLSALSAIQSHQGINPRSIEEADVFAVRLDERVRIRREEASPVRRIRLRDRVVGRVLAVAPAIEDQEKDGTRSRHRIGSGRGYIGPAMLAERPRPGYCGPVAGPGGRE